jgi:hypothetical protein
MLKDNDFEVDDLDGEDEENWLEVVDEDDNTVYYSDHFETYQQMKDEMDKWDKLGPYGYYLGGPVIEQNKKVAEKTKRS